ncbi:MAG: PKD domain-containing protein, partial [Microbacterium sp.]|uniref:PKD domain-containing protein n=1 Tax=Microbacterium sp. TaxID=51671 RepID=UPI003A858AF7
NGGRAAPLPAPSPSPSQYWSDDCFDDPTQPYLCAPVEGEGEAIPTVSASDLASFVPAMPSLGGEPDGVGLVGAPTNVIAGSTEHDVHGSLFGRDVSVRFTPAAYRFDYGDGTSQTTTTGGASWSSLGQAQFTPTATSHVYRARGTYTVTVATLFDATVQWGSVRIPVTGQVASTPAGYEVRIVEAHTALVDRNCIEDPNGVGC